MIQVLHQPWRPTSVREAPARARDSLHADLGEKRVVIGRLLSLSRAHDFATTHPVSRVPGTNR